MNDSILINNKLRMKESNTNLVLSTLHQVNSATCAEVSKLTGLSIATCGNILKRLLDSGEVLEGSLESYSSGRPAKKYIYNENFSLIIAVTLHTEDSMRYLQYAVANLYGNIIEHNTQTFDHINFDTINDIIRKSIDDHMGIKAVGIGLPAVITNKGDIINSDISEINDSNILDLTGNLGEKIETAANSSPAVSIYGYHKNHPELKNKVSVSLLCPSDPIGAGIVINDQIYNGDFNIGGEIGFVCNRLFDNYLSSECGQDNKIKNVIFAIASIVSTINPTTIVLMGADFSKELFSKISSCCKALFPADFFPKLVLLNDYSDVYLNGTVQIAIDCLKPKIKLVAR